MYFRRGLAGILEALTHRHDSGALLLPYLTSVRSSYATGRQARPRSEDGKQGFSGSAPKEEPGDLCACDPSETRAFEGLRVGEECVRFVLSDSDGEEMELPGKADWKEVPFEEKECPRPAEIPWQLKVANSVNLIGRVGVPVHLETFPDGSAYAIAILEQKKTPNFPQLWIPVIFQGDLAGIAACHLKEDDRIHVSGQLSADSPQIVIENHQSTVHVMAQTLSFVQTKSQARKTELLHEKLPHATPLPDKEKGSTFANPLWDDLLANPGNWMDLRNSKTNNQPDFKHKTSGEALWIGKSTPTSVMSALKSPTFCQKLSQRTTVGKETKTKSMEDSWKDLIDNPGKWWDNRSTKANPRAPDFKHKVSGEGLWLDSSPDWVRSKFYQYSRK